MCRYLKRLGNAILNENISFLLSKQFFFNNPPLEIFLLTVPHLKILNHIHRAVFIYVILCLSKSVLQLEPLRSDNDLEYCKVTIGFELYL